MLSESSEGYSSGGESYDLTQECLYLDSNIPNKGDRLGMPREGDQLPPHVQEPSGAQTPPGSHVAQLEKLRELHNKLKEEQQWLQQLQQALEREVVAEPSTKAHGRRRTTSSITSRKTPTPPSPPSSIE
jgi:hypothetical protein